MNAIKNPFGPCFKFLSFYSFYLPENSKIQWKMCGVFIFLYGILHYFVASIYRLQGYSSYMDMLLPILHVIFSLNLVAKIVNFKWNEKKIMEILATFDKLDKELDKEKVEKQMEMAKKFVILLISSDLFIGTTLGISILLFSQEKSFILPVLFSSENDVVHYILFAIAFPGVVVVGTSLTSVESIFTMSLIMIEIHIGELKRKIEKSTGVSKCNLKELVDYQLSIEG
jgi:hypothetical protein